MDKAELFNQKAGVLDNPELRRLKLLFGINMFLLYAAFLMPQYFGVHIGYDITCTRFANILLTFYALLQYKVFNAFTKTFLRCSMSIPLVLYLLVATYTMVFRVDVNALMLVFLEILTLYMMVFAIRYVIGVRRAIKAIVFCAYFLSIYGLVEFVAGHSLYLQFLRTVPTSVANCYRSGYYRIMGPCGHALGYGLLLIIFIAIACIDVEKDEVYLLKNPILLFLLIINVFLTGSRSSQGIAAVEIIVLLLISNRVNKKKALLYLSFLIVAVGLFLLVGSGTKIGHYLLMQITTLIDQVFDTTLSANFGVDVTTLHNSEEYRKYLPRIFTLDWLNPLVGRGVKRSFGAEILTEKGSVYLISIDNYYVAQYIKYAYPGLVCYALFILVTGATMIRSIVKYKSGIMKAIFVGFCCYFYNLWWLDALQTLKFVYVIIAVFYALLFVFQDTSKKDILFDVKSKVVKGKGFYNEDSTSRIGVCAK